MKTEERAFWVAFNHIRGVGSVRVQKLLKAFGSLQAAWSASRTELLQAGLDERTTTAIAAGRAGLDPHKLLDRCRTLGLKVLVLDDSDYPPRLKELPSPPPVLYLRGAMTEADGLAVAIVGTRRATAYGKEAARMFASALAVSGITVISGMARGIDAEAHTSALDHHGRTLAVLGCGADVIYPPEHQRLARRIAESGAILSDYAPGTPPDAANFPPRNRIIAGLSLATLVVEAGEESGALLTACYAAEYGRDVFAVPGNIFSVQSRGCNRLIGDGAQPAVSPEALIAALDLPRLAPALQMRMIVPESPVEAKILEALGAEPVHIDRLRASLGLPVETVSGALAMMELKGMVRTVGGMQYVAASPRPSADHSE
jgi:DNA processing protein